MLADNAFKYQITLSNKIVLPTTILTPYIFNLSPNSRYNDIEIQLIFIDSRLSTQSTEAIC